MHDQILGTAFAVVGLVWLVAYLFGAKCPKCEDRSRDLAAHLELDHADEGV